MRRQKVRLPNGISEAEDEVRSTLEGLEYAANDELRWLADKEEVEQPEDHRAYLQALAKQRLGLIALVLRAAERGDTWAAVDNALLLGIRSGIDQSFPYQYHPERKLRLQEPEVAKQRKAVSNRQEAADARRRETPPIAELLEMVKAKRASNPRVSRTEAVKRVAKDLEIDERTLRRRLKAAEKSVDNLSVP